MFNKKALLILLVVVFIFIGGAYASAQDITTKFTGTTEFEIGVQLGMMINGPAADDPNFQNINWGFISDYEGKANIHLAYEIFSGDSNGNYAITSGLDFQLHEKAIGTGYAHFHDILGLGNDLAFHFSNDDVDYDGSNAYVSLKAIFNLEMLKVYGGIVDYMNDGIREAGSGLAPNPSGQVPDAGETDPKDVEDTFSETKIEAGMTDLAFGEVFTLEAGLAFSFMNTIGMELDDIEGDLYDPENNGYGFGNNGGGSGAWELKFNVGGNVIMDGLMSLEFSETFKFTEIQYIKNEVHLLFSLDAVDNLTFTVLADLHFDYCGGPQIVKGEDDLIITPLEFRVTRFPILINIAYTVDPGVLLTFKGEGYIDSSDVMSNNDPLGDPRLAFHGKVGIDIGLGENGLFTIPFYIKLTNISFNADYDIDEDDLDFTLVDENIRILIGLGVHVEF